MLAREMSLPRRPLFIFDHIRNIGNVIIDGLMVSLLNERNTMMVDRTK